MHKMILQASGILVLFYNLIDIAQTILFCWIMQWNNLIYDKELEITIAAW